MKPIEIFNFNIQNVGRILSEKDKRYSISYFQRDYSWGKDEWTRFVDDIVESLKGKRQHFFGFMTFLKSKNNPNEFQIIEGQQRLATVTILTAVVRDLFLARKNGKWKDIDGELIKTKDLFSDKIHSKLELSDMNNDFFRDYIQKEGKPLDKIEEMKKKKNLKSTNRLIRDCYEYVHERVKADSERALLEILQQATKEFLVMTAEVTGLSSAYILFQTLNDRGLDLTLSDLLKTHLLQTSGGEWKEVKKDWDYILNLPGMDNVNMFLRHYWLSKEDIVHEEELFDKFSKQIKDKYRVFKFVEELKKEAEKYSALWDPEPSDFEGDKRIVELLKTELYTLSKRQVMPLLLSVYGRFDNKELVRLAEVTTSFIFRYLTIGEQENKELERLFSEVARCVREGRIKSVEGIAKEFKKKDITDELFVELFKTKQLKDNKRAVYILTKIEEFLRGQEGEFSPDISLEHIMPVNPDDECKKYMEQNKMIEDKDELVHRLGNMTLLLKKPNKRARNKLPMVKSKEIYNKATSLKINDDLKNLGQWTAKDIEERQEKLASHAVNIWRL